MIPCLWDRSKKHKVLCLRKGICSNLRKRIGNSQLKKHPHEIQNAKHWPTSKENNNHNKIGKAGIYSWQHSSNTGKKLIDTHCWDYQRRLLWEAHLWQRNPHQNGHNMASRSYRGPARPDVLITSNQTTLKSAFWQVRTNNTLIFHQKKL